MLYTVHQASAQANGSFLIHREIIVNAPTGSSCGTCISVTILHHASNHQCDHRHSPPRPLSLNDYLATRIRPRATRRVLSGHPDRAQPFSDTSIPLRTPRSFQLAGTFSLRITQTAPALWLPRSPALAISLATLAWTPKPIELTICPALWNETKATLPAPFPAFLVHPETFPSEAVKLWVLAA